MLKTCAAVITRIAPAFTFSQANYRSSAPRPPTEEPTMPALIDLWLMPARLWLDLVAPLKLAPLATDVVPLAKARYIRRKRKVLRSKRGD
jgi:hypothetical protein